MLHTFDNREKFINSAISLLRTHNFDGLDLFFLYPGLRNSPTHDRWKFLFLIEAYAMNYWRNLGAPSEKLMMGFPTYGRTFCLLKPSDNGLQAIATGPASPGKYTKQAGILAYYEICSFLEKARKDWIGYQHVPYAYKGKEWVGYDDIRSFQEKAKFVKAEHFGGAMVWTLDMDDVKGAFCGSGPFPLLYKLNYLLLQDGIYSKQALPSGSEVAWVRKMESGSGNFSWGELNSLPSFKTYKIDITSSQTKSRGSHIKITGAN
uniref:Oviduct-specific glycoprotein n=1 Tax=Marmota marmota marmota TaxID=9994 RepID=A0A8C5ZHM9_MARMA